MAAVPSLARQGFRPQIGTNRRKGQKYFLYALGMKADYGFQENCLISKTKKYIKVLSLLIYTIKQSCQYCIDIL